jgi:hypothetical protein
VSCIGPDITWSDSFEAARLFNAGLDFSCTNYSPGTHDDWRVPSIRELMSLMDFGNDPALPEDHPFLSVPICNIWASTSSASEPSRAWDVTFSTYVGAQSYLEKTFEKCVWPVRGGQ